MSLNISPDQWRRRTTGGIPYKVVSSGGSFSPDASNAQETYIIRASDLSAFVEESFPSSISFGGFIVWGNPRRMPGYPLMETKNIAFKSFIDGKPIDSFAADSGAPAGTYGGWVELTISYEVAKLKDPEGKDQADPVTFLEISSKATPSILAVPVSNLSWWQGLGGSSMDEKVKDADIPKNTVEPIVEWTFKWPQVPYSFFSDTLISRIRSAMGKVNSGPTALFHNSPAETILFLGYSISQSVTWQRGVGVQYPPLNVEFQFQEKSFFQFGMQVTHNHLYRPRNGLYRRILTDGQPLYGQTNFNDVFRIA